MRHERQPGFDGPADVRLPGNVLDDMPADVGRECLVPDPRVPDVLRAEGHRSRFHRQGDAIVEARRRVGQPVTQPARARLAEVQFRCQIRQIFELGHQSLECRVCTASHLGRDLADRAGTEPDAGEHRPVLLRLAEAFLLVELGANARAHDAVGRQGQSDDVLRSVAGGIDLREIGRQPAECRVEFDALAHRTAPQHLSAVVVVERCQHERGVQPSVERRPALLKRRQRAYR